VDAHALYEAGRLDDAIASLSAGLRTHPGDAGQRTFLFELLCFAGQYDRADRQLDVLVTGGREAELGGLLYRSALHAERQRSRKFEGDAPAHTAPATAVAGSLNGRRFTSIADADPRIGARLELYVAGQYTWLPFQHVASLTCAPPRRLRDLLWIPAQLTASAGLTGAGPSEVLLPAITPLAWGEPDDRLRLGRATEWRRLQTGTEVPIGQKLLLVDGDEVPILEVRELVITPFPA